MFVVTVSIEIDPAHREAFLAATKQLSQASLTEEGCQQFDLCQNPETPNQLFIYERYTDEAAFGLHKEDAHSAVWKKATEGMILNKVGQKMELLSA